jgi:ectoine hydroxylase-related dioxygenase (phytanoyl-CoA dioxygenase family)
VATVAAELDVHFKATPRCVGDFYGWKTTRMGAVLTKAPSTRALLLHEAIWPAVETILKPACDYVQLNLVQAVRVHPGERAQAPHRDEEMWPCAKHGVPWLINVMWAVDDFTEENGATRLWPKSHNEGLDRFIDPAQSIPAEMPKGSACLFMGALTHGAGANRSDRYRTGIIVSYCLGWLKTYENQFLTYPPAVARSFDPVLQSLIGYRIHRPNLGGWNGQDPNVLLRDHDQYPAHEDALPPEIAAELRTYYDAA